MQGNSATSVNRQARELLVYSMEFIDGGIWSEAATLQVVNGVKEKRTTAQNASARPMNSVPEF